MNMCNSLKTWFVVGLAGLSLLPCGGLLAQQRTTARGARGGTGALSSTSGASREYSPNGTVGEATVSVDPETGALIVITDEDTSKYISQVVSNLDRPEPQVLIKVVFMEVTHNNNSDIGIEGAFGKNIGNSMTSTVANVFGANGLNTLTTNFNPVGPAPAVTALTQAAPGAGLYQILGSDFQATLRAIAQAGKTEVLSRPSILARNNQLATITVGQSVPVATTVSFTGASGTPVSSIQYRDVGIILNVTPFIKPNGMVEMIVSPEISQISGQTVGVGNGVNLPIFDQRAANTVVVTPDGQTVIIGGLMQNQKTQADSKIPLLGDIPLLGNLFRRRSKGNTKTELLIFLTPHIVYEPSQLVGLSSEERGKTQMTRKAFSEEELNQFLDAVPTSNGDSSSKKRK